MESLVHYILVLLIFSGFEIDCQLNLGRPLQPLEPAFSFDVDNNPVPQLENTQPQSDSPYSYPYPYSMWPLNQHAGIPPPPYYGGPPAFPYAPAPYPWYSPPQIPFQPEVVPAPNFPMPQVQPMQELINLGSQSPSTPPCATILTTSNCILRVPDDGLHKDVHERSFVFAAGLIKEQCSLTVKDCSGSYFTSSNYLFSPGSSCVTASSVCCECFGCARGNFQLYENSCAILFENVKCSTCSGFRLEIGDGDAVSVMNPLVDDKVSSIYVLPNCELYVFTRTDFQGDAAIAQGSFDDLPYAWNDEISSYKCSCPTRSSPVPTVPPSQTQGTLNPIESTVPSTQGSTSVQPIIVTSMPTSVQPTTITSIMPTSVISISTTAVGGETTPLTTRQPETTSAFTTTTTVKPATDPEIITTTKLEPTSTPAPETTTTSKQPLTSTPAPELPSTPNPEVRTTPEVIRDTDTPTY